MRAFIFYYNKLGTKPEIKIVILKVNNLYNELIRAKVVV